MAATENRGSVPVCARCQDAPAGPGRILCPDCKTALESRTVADWYPEPAS
jgi:hypothetical protein